MSPDAALIYVDNIRDAFVEHDPANAATYKANAEAYKTKIKATIDPIRAELAGDPRGAALAGDERGRVQLSRPRFRPEGALPLADQRRPAGHAAAGAQGHRRRCARTTSRSSSARARSPTSRRSRSRARPARKYGGVLYVDSLSEADGPVPTYLDLLRVTSETIAKGLAAMNEAVLRARPAHRRCRSRHGHRRRGRHRHLPQRPHRAARRELRDPDRHDHRAGRRQRQRQVDAVQGDHGLRAARRRGRSASSACRSTRR